MLIEASNNESVPCNIKKIVIAIKCKDFCLALDSNILSHHFFLFRWSYFKCYSQVEEVEGRKVNIAFINFFYGETFPFKEGASLHNAQWLDFRINKKPNNITNFSSLMGCGSIWHGDHSFPSSFGILQLCTFLLHSTTSSFATWVISFPFSSMEPFYVLLFLKFPWRKFLHSLC